MMAVLLPFTIAMMAAMPWLMLVLAPGFVDSPDQFAHAVDLARVTFPYLLLISLVALQGGVLNSLGKFGPFAAAPIVFNLALIAALLLSAAFGYDPGTAMAYGITASGALQLIWLALSCRRAGLALRLPWPRISPQVKRLFALMAPGALGAGVIQINLLIGMMLATLLPTGAVSYLYYADRLNQLPLGVIGIAIGSALLPVLSAHVAAGDQTSIRRDMSRALEIALLFGLPAALALAAAAEPIIRTLFERNRFGPADSVATAQALAAYATGIPAYVVAKVFGAAYFARQDTATPVKVAIAATVANGVAAATLIQFLDHVGIALASALSSWLQVILLANGLRRRGLLEFDDRIKHRAPRILLAGAVMGLAVLAGAVLLYDWFTGSGAGRWVALLSLLGTGAAIYGGLLLVLGAADWRELAGLMRRHRAPAAP
jgi:putative peptidoglycan lipid II flippase